MTFMWEFLKKKWIQETFFLLKEFKEQNQEINLEQVKVIIERQKNNQSIDFNKRNKL